MDLNGFRSIPFDSQTKRFDARHSAKLDAVKTFMRQRRVSEELQGKVIRW